MRENSGNLQKEKETQTFLSRHLAATSLKVSSAKILGCPLQMIPIALIAATRTFSSGSSSLDFSIAIKNVNVKVNIIIKTYAPWFESYQGDSTRFPL